MKRSSGIKLNFCFNRISNLQAYDDQSSTGEHTELQESRLPHFLSLFSDGTVDEHRDSILIFIDKINSSNEK